MKLSIPKIAIPFLLLGWFAVSWTGNIFAQSTNTWWWKTVGSDEARRPFVVSNDLFQIRGAAAPTVLTEAKREFVFQTLRGNGQIIARLVESQNPSKQRGVMIRETLATNSAFAWMAVTNGSVRFDRHIQAIGNIISTSETNVTAPRWLRLVREGNAFSGFHSHDGTNWVQLSADTLEMPQDVLVGVAASSDGESAFSDVRTMSARLITPPLNVTHTLPTNLLIEAELAGFESQAKKVEFFVDAKKIGEAVRAPYSMVWTNPLSGNVSISAKVTSDAQTDFFTEPVNCEFKMPPASAKFVRTDSETKGTWNNQFGKEGFLVVHHATNYPAYAAVSPRRHKSILLTHSGDPSALRLTNATGGIIALWFSQTNMIINVSLRDGHLHQVAFYCHDWDGNLRVQLIQVIDPVTRRVLDERRVANFHAGKYLTWNIQGAVTFKITAIAGNAVVSGIFFDSARHHPQ